VGLVTVRAAHNGSEPRYTTATGTGSDEVESLATATLSALGATDDLLAFYAAGLCEAGAVRSATVVEAAGVRFHEGAETEAHLGLVGVLPSPGRLTVATSDVEHRVLCLPDAAIVMTVGLGDPIGARIDATFLRIEAAAYEPRCPEHSPG
jgi:hypothetical protein